VGALGILAGGGELPARLVAACRASARPHFVIAFEGQTDAATVADAPHAWLRLGAGRAALDRLKAEGVDELVMAGRIRRPSLAELRPDLWTAGFLARAGFASLGDDGLLKAIVRELESEGFRLIGPDQVLGDLLAPIGVLTRARPDAEEEADIRRAVAVAKALGAVDVGQAVIVQQGLVLGVEAIEGTDALIERCGKLRREGRGGVLVKCRKPGQERRADLPTIGVATIEHAVAAGLAGIAVEAGGALILDRSAVVQAADHANIFVVGLTVP
jgi:UDP-2,3-diacylglucosamine hydrolase